MFCRKCGSQLAEDAAFCHKCGTPPVKLEEKKITPEPAPIQNIEDIAKYDIVLVDITTREELSEKAHMAVAYVLFEDEIKRVSGGLEPDPNMKRQVQDEATRNAYNMAQSLPVTLKRSVSKKEALFFKERLARYGVTVLLGYCPNCGGSLSNLSDRCATCGQAAIELGDSVVNATAVKAEEPMLGQSSSFCRKCGTMSQGEAQFCRKCGSPTGDPPAFATPKAQSTVVQNTLEKAKQASAVVTKAIPLAVSSKTQPVQESENSIPQPRQNQNTKIYTIVKKIAIAAFVIFLIVNMGRCMFSGGNSNTTTPDRVAVGVGQRIGNYDIEIKNYMLTQTRVWTTDYHLIVITYEWTNNSGGPKSFNHVIQHYAFQNGIACNEHGFLVDSVGETAPENSPWREIQSGATQSVRIIYELQNRSSPVTIEVGSTQGNFSHTINISSTR